ERGSGTQSATEKLSDGYNDGHAVATNYLFTLLRFSEARRDATDALGSSRRARPDPAHPPLRI
ncbi:MAG: hypothetical protein WCC81_13860, partial [Pseudolabrys sp.]